MGKKFGRIHTKDLDNPSVHEAMQALMNTVEGFRQWMVANQNKGFHVFLDNRNIGEGQLGEFCPGAKIRISPAYRGSKNGGIFQTILGAVLIVAGVLVTGLTYGWAAPVGKAMIGMGIGMALGGIAQLINPPTNEPKDKPENTPSYVFNGPVNTTAQGRSVPVLYGELEVGSAVLSAGITVDQGTTGASGGSSTGGGWTGGGGHVLTVPAE